MVGRPKSVPTHHRISNAIGKTSTIANKRAILTAIT